MKAFLLLLLVLSPVDLTKYCSVTASADTMSSLEIVSDYLELTKNCKRWNGFQSELRWIRLNYRKCCYYPPTNDALRFPSTQALYTSLHLTRQYTDFLESRIKICPEKQELIYSLLKEAEQIDTIYRTATNAVDSYNSGILIYRRQGLQELKELLGDEAYYTGKLPPPLPVWRFVEKD